MARQRHPADLDNTIRIRATALEQKLVGLGKATERFILSYTGIPGKKVPQDWERNIGRRSLRAAAKGRPVGGALVGRFRVTAEHWRLSQYIYRRRVRNGWAYEVLIQYRGNGNVQMVKLRKCILAGDKLTEHTEG